MSETNTMTNKQESDEPTAIGEPYQIDTIQEPCWDCGVVQEMKLVRQEYRGMTDSDYPIGTCAVCGNKHDKNPPW